MSISPTEETTAIEQATTNEETAIIKQTASTERNVTIEKTNTTEQENTIEKTATIKETNSNKQTINTEDIRNTVIHEYTVNGLSQRKIAVMIGTSQMTVCNILKKHALSTGKSIKRGKEKTLMNEDIRNTVIHEYTVNGLSQEKIAIMIGTSQATVCNILKKHALSTGKSIKPPKKRTLIDKDIRNAVIHEYTVNGPTQKRIAAVVGISESAVYRIWKAYRERVSLEPITDIETKSIINEVEVNLQVESQSITDNEEIKQEQDQSSCTLDL